MTGAGGFVGQAVLRQLRAAGHEVRCALRTSRAEMRPADIEQVVVGPFDGEPSWARALAGVDAVVHLAACAHVSGAGARDEAAFMTANCEATLSLARACAGRVGRLVFISTIGVHGALSAPGGFAEDSPLNPRTPYARSKLRAEEGLRELAEQSDLSLGILRPPLVYGPGAPGNLARLMQVVRRGIPLPLAAVDNARSLIGREHLARSIEAVLVADSLPRPVFCVADREVLATPEIIRAIAAGYGRPARLFSVPPALLRSLARLSASEARLEQLTGSLVVNASRFREVFGDLQNRPASEGLREMVAHE